MTSGGFSSSKDGISHRNSLPIHDSGNLTNQLEKLDLNQSHGSCLIYILHGLKAKYFFVAKKSAALAFRKINNDIF